MLREKRTHFRNKCEFIQEAKSVRGKTFQYIEQDVLKHFDIPFLFKNNLCLHVSISELLTEIVFYQLQTSTFSFKLLPFLFKRILNPSINFLNYYIKIEIIA